jgi:hypothetical protein
MLISLRLNLRVVKNQKQKVVHQYKVHTISKPALCGFVLLLCGHLLHAQFCGIFVEIEAKIQNIQNIQRYTYQSAFIR